eukprot:TRINITY_DN34241_c0_g1_i5.p1 TRINITY_DN34241_c0_g1~~TRINITY_DN34241_c0_g1_i5.p1  ORF type:complete len:216 (+),score=18.05 TRINITY_DN34241_c0_g1_i5:84-650(+)
MNARVCPRAPLRAAAVPARRAVRANAAAGDLTLKIKLKAYNVPVLEEAVSKIQQAVSNTGANLSGTVPLPTRRRIYCVLRSPHVNSNSREHFEIRTHQRLIHVKDVTREAVQSLMNINLPAGVDCNVKLQRPQSAIISVAQQTDGQAHECSGLVTRKRLEARTWPGRAATLPPLAVVATGAQQEQMMQ